MSNAAIPRTKGWYCPPRQATTSSSSLMAATISASAAKRLRSTYSKPMSTRSATTASLITEPSPRSSSATSYRRSRLFRPVALSPRQLITAPARSPHSSPPRTCCGLSPSLRAVPTTAAGLSPTSSRRIWSPTCGSSSPPRYTRRSPPARTASSSCTAPTRCSIRRPHSRSCLRRRCRSFSPAANDRLTDHPRIT